MMFNPEGRLSTEENAEAGEQAWVQAVAALEEMEGQEASAPEPRLAQRRRLGRLGTWLAAGLLPVLAIGCGKGAESGIATPEGGLNSAGTAAAQVYEAGQRAVDWLTEHQVAALPTGEYLISLDNRGVIKYQVDAATYAELQGLTKGGNLPETIKIQRLIHEISARGQQVSWNN